MHGVVQCFSNYKVHTDQLPGDLVKMQLLIQKVWGQTKILPRFLTGSQVKLMLQPSDRTLNSKGWNNHMNTNKNLVSIEEALNIVSRYIKCLISNPCLLLINVAWKALEMQIPCPGQETSYASGMRIREIWVINSKLTPYSMHHSGKLFNLSVLPFSPFGLLREINETVAVVT